MRGTRLGKGMKACSEISFRWVLAGVVGVGVRLRIGPEGGENEKN